MAQKYYFNFCVAQKQKRSAIKIPDLIIDINTQLPKLKLHEVQLSYYFGNDSKLAEHPESYWDNN